ncbi:hypothetical protein ACMYR3_11310 [Ampullimonas aquatilis]|uniref:hypothetical protein n=1 Tax=Ampullimonas aquatilis TaxID=1341549 RepID=UPI003C72164B
MYEKFIWYVIVVVFISSILCWGRLSGSSSSSGWHSGGGFYGSGGFSGGGHK